MKLFTKQERKTIVGYLVPIDQQTEKLKRDHPEAWNSPDARILRDMDAGDAQERKRLQRLTDEDLQAALRTMYEQRQRIVVEKAKGAELSCQEEADNAKMKRLADIGEKVTFGGRKTAQAREPNTNMEAFLTEAQRLMDAGKSKALAAHLAAKKTGFGSLATLKRHLLKK